MMPHATVCNFKFVADFCGGGAMTTTYVTIGGPSSGMNGGIATQHVGIQGHVHQPMQYQGGMGDSLTMAMESIPMHMGIAHQQAAPPKGVHPAFRQMSHSFSHRVDRGRSMSASVVGWHGSGGSASSTPRGRVQRISELLPRRSLSLSPARLGDRPQGLMPARPADPYSYDDHASYSMSGTPPIRLFCYGDSLTAGWHAGGMSRSPYAPALEQALKKLMNCQVLIRHKG